MVIMVSEEEFQKHYFSFSNCVSFIWPISQQIPDSGTALLEEIAKLQEVFLE